MIRKIPKIIHVTALNYGESGAICKWNSGNRCNGIIVTRRGNNLKSAIKLPECPINNPFFNRSRRSGMDVMLDSDMDAFMVVRQ